MLPSRVHPSVCLSVISRYCIETTGRIEAVLVTGACFHLSHTVCKEIWVSLKTGVSGTSSQTSYLENFAAASRSRGQLFVVVVDGRVCWRHLHYDNRRVVAVYYKLINCNHRTAFDLWVCRTTCLYSWQDFNWHNASRGLSAVAEFLVRWRSLSVYVCWSRKGAALNSYTHRFVVWG